MDDFWFSFVSAACVFVGLSAGCYVWELFQNTPDFARAFDRSLFQAVAVLATWFVLEVPHP